MVPSTSGLSVFQEKEEKPLSQVRVNFFGSKLSLIHLPTLRFSQDSPDISLGLEKPLGFPLLN